MPATEADRIEEIKSHLQDIWSEKYYLLMKLFEFGHAKWNTTRVFPMKGGTNRC